MEKNKKMKIVEYTLGVPPFRRGGLPRYSTDLSSELALKHDVYVLYPGHNTLINSRKVKVVNNKSDKYDFSIMELVNPLPVSLGLGISESGPFMEKRDVSMAVEWLKELSPNIFHIHTLMGLPKELLYEIKKLNIKVVFTTHDFYGLCPKMLLNNPVKELSNRKCTYDCMLCKDGPSKLKLDIMQSNLYKWLKDSSFIKILRSNQKSALNGAEEQREVSEQESQARFMLRKYYLEMFALIDKFHFNSTVSKKYFEKYFSHLKGEVLSITHEGLVDRRNEFANQQSTSNHIKLAYIGPYDEKKGFFMLIEVLKKLRLKYQNFDIYFYGDIAQYSFFKEEWVHNEGIYSGNDMGKIYKSVDLVVLPSLWHETFGFVVLESILSGTPVLVSDNVGAGDILPESFKFRDEKVLVDCLSKILLNGVDSYKKELLNLPIIYTMKDHVIEVEKEFYV
ncbi:glycosyltransferase [Ligilactobacillus equi]|uniref:Serine O-acetyltransferase n=1 Tax=Ligilactobacillus equi DPC 6820 TaxID=1392007 RepID=V7HX27_9LACO|nr:glycosyltransferase [Ligilactobacillus equi]ETA74794.1 serine O-acetyltransferase [Ligilactobacillus equi DPC 6820]